jgi:hypothetical protein
MTQGPRQSSASPCPTSSAWFDTQCSAPSQYLDACQLGDSIVRVLFASLSFGQSEMKIFF